MLSDVYNLVKKQLKRAINKNTSLSEIIKSRYRFCAGILEYCNRGGVSAWWLQFNHILDDSCLFNCTKTQQDFSAASRNKVSLDVQFTEFKFSLVVTQVNER